MLHTKPSQEFFLKTNNIINNNLDYKIHIVVRLSIRKVGRLFLVPGKEVYYGTEFRFKDHQWKEIDELEEKITELNLNQRKQQKVIDKIPPEYLQELSKKERERRRKEEREAR